MNFRPFARGLAPYLTAYLLLVSLGLPLHKVYCACKGESDFSLLAIEHECRHGDAEALRLQSSHHLSGSKAKKPSCCGSDRSASCAQSSTEQHDCGDEEVLLAKLTVDYLFEQDNDLAFELPLKSVLTKYYFDYLPARRLIAKITPVRGPSPPPLPYGRDLLLRRQLFLC